MAAAVIGAELQLRHALAIGRPRRASRPVLVHTDRPVALTRDLGTNPYEKADASELCGRSGKKKALSIAAKCLIFMVGGAGFEPATPAV